MAKVITKLFKLRTNADHYVDFQAGMDSFRFEFKWNEYERRYALNIYKNLELKVSSYFLVWSLDNILDAFDYMNLGSLRCVSEEGKITEEGVFNYDEITIDNVKEAIFRWDYEII